MTDRINTLDELRAEAKRLKDEINQLRQNPPKPDAEGDISSKAIEEHAKRLNTLTDDYRATLNNITTAEAREAPKTTVAPERKAAAQERQKQAAGAAQTGSIKSAKDYIQELEDSQALGQIGEEEAKRKWEVFWASSPENPAVQAKKEAADRQRKLDAQTAQNRADANRISNANLGINRSQEERAGRTETRTASNQDRSNALDTYKIGVEAGDKAISREEKKREQARYQAYGAARSSGKDPLGAISEADKVPSIDFDAVAEAGTRRALQQLQSFGVGVPSAAVPGPIPAGQSASTYNPDTQETTAVPGPVPTYAGAAAAVPAATAAPVPAPSAPPVGQLRPLDPEEQKRRMLQGAALGRAG